MQQPNQQYQYTRLTASGLVKSGQGLLGGFLVASGTPTIQLFDSLTAGGTLILNTMQLSAATAYPVPAFFNNGVYAVIAGAGDITFFYN
jgi:hypothetical protein